MSTTPPTEPTPDQPSAAQPTEAYPAPEQPTQAYGAPAAPTQAYPYAQPTAPYGVAPQPAGPDTRSKTLAWTALVLAIVGIVLSLVGFVPVAILGVIAVLIGGLVLLAGFVISIVALVGKRHGGTPLSITALVLSVVGTGIAMVALTIALVFTGLSVAGTSSSTDVSPDTQTSDPATDDGTTDDGTTDDGTTDDGTTDAGTLSAGEEAFLAEVRPQITQLLVDIDPTVSAADVDSVFPDDALITIGQTLLVTGDAGIDAIVDQTLSTAGDAVDADQLRSLYEAIYAAAQAHLQ